MNNFPSEMYLYVPKYISLNTPNKEFGDNIFIIFQCCYFFFNKSLFQFIQKVNILLLMCICSHEVHLQMLRGPLKAWFQSESHLYTFPRILTVGHSHTMTWPCPLPP